MVTLLLLLAYPDTVTLRDAGGPSRCDLALTVRGKLKVAADGKPVELPLTAKATHTFTEHPDRPGRTVRVYEAASSTATADGERSVRELSADRRRIVADGPTHYSPAGPLTRDELELVSEHLSPAVLAPLLPGRPLTAGDSWAVSPEAVQAACHLDGVGKCDVVGQLKTGGPLATFTLSGTADGVENGAAVKLRLSVSGTFDVAASRITKVTWEQTDDRSQGPASPASEVQAVAELVRTPAAADAAATANLPAGDAVPEGLLDLTHADSRGRYRLILARGWRIVVQSPDYLVLRLVDRGEFVAQATFNVWKSAAPGGHATPDEFRAALSRLPGWEPEAELSAGEVPTAAGRWGYRVVARGKQDGQPIIQSAYLLAGPTGGQLAVGVIVSPDKAGALAGRDERLVRGVEVK